MEYSNLGKAGVQVSRICLGMMSYGSSQWRSWILDEPAARPFVQRALEAGINFFDTADMYSAGMSEEVTGRLLKEYARRDEVIVATKVYHPTGPGPNARGLSRQHIFRSIDASLKRLGMDYVDLYQIHRWDNETPIEETLEALNDLVRMGKVLYIGASSMFAWQFTQALYTSRLHGWSQFVSMQNHYNLVYREEEREMMPLCQAEGIGVLPWSPLARGFLAGNRTRADQAATERSRVDQFARDMYFQEPDFQVLDRVLELAKQREVKPAQLALAWLLHKPGVTSPIIGATKLQHLEDALAALELKLSGEEMAFLEESYQPHGVLGH